MSAIMTSRQAAELDHAFERNGWNAEMVKKLSEGDILAQVAAVILGQAVIKFVKRVITRFPFDPATVLGQGWSWWRGPISGNGLKGEEDSDLRSLARLKIDMVKVLRETCLKEGEPSITGEEKLSRLKVSGNILLDPCFGWALYNESGQNTLRWLYDTFGTTYIDFFGRILRNPDGYRYVLCLDRGDDCSWARGIYWLGNELDASHSSAVLPANN